MDAKLWGQEDEQVQPKRSSFSDIFDNIGAWGRAAYADTMAIPMGRQIKDVYDKIENGQYSSREEYDSLVADLDRLQNERNEYRDAFNENQKILNQNDSYLKDFTEIGGTVQGIGRQARDTLIGAGLGAIGGSVVPVAGTASGAMTGARIGNFIGSIDQAAQDADTNAIDAWEKVLQEGGTSEQAEQAYKDAFWNNMPTEALDILSSLYMGGKLLGSTSKILNRALGGKLAGTLANGVNKAARFDLPAKVGTYVANKSGKAWLGQGVGVGLGMLGNAAEEGIQEPWQDYATERAVDIQRRQYDPTHEGIRDFSVFGDGGLLDYYTTPEGMNTAIKAAKMGAAFGGVGGLMSKSQFTELGTAHSDSIQSAKREADWIDKQGLLKDKGNLERYNNVKETMANIYELSEDEKADLSVEDVARMYHEYYTNLYGQGGNRQEQNAVSQADFLNEITGEETARRGLMGDTATKYIDKFGIRPDNETLVGINDNQQVLSEEQVQETLEQDGQETTEEGTENKKGIDAKTTKGTMNNKTGSYIKERTGQNGEQVQQKKGGLREQYGKWKRVDEGEDYDYSYESKYRNEETGRVARITKVNGGYTITDITDKEEGTPTIAKTLKDVTKFLGKKANQKTRFMSDGTQEQVSQALPQEDGVIATKDITKDENGEQWFNGKKIQSNKAQTIHSMQDLHDYYKTHKDLMSKDLYAEISRQMMRFGIGNANNTEIVLDLTNREAGGFGSETTIRTDPNDENSAVAKAIVRLYAGADLATAAHEMAHLGWMNLSDQDRATFTKWAEKTQGEFVAKILGMDYDQNFRSYLIEALTNRESQTSQDLWAKIKKEGAVQQTLGILNGQNYGLAVEERFAWEFSNWYAQGYIKGAKPRNIIERILNKACATLQGALNLLSDTNRYLNGENGYNGGDINNIFTNMSTRGIGQQRQTVAPQEQVETVTRMDYAPEMGYDLAQGLPNVADSELGMTLEEEPEQNLSGNYGTTRVNQKAEKTAQQKTKTGYGEGVANNNETLGQYRERMKKEAEQKKEEKKQNYTPTTQYKPKERNRKISGYEQTSPQGETLEQYRKREAEEAEKYKVPTSLKGVRKLLTIVKNRKEGWQRALQSLKQIDPRKFRSIKTQIGNDLWGVSEDYVNDGNDLWGQPQQRSLFGEEFEETKSEPKTQVEETTEETKKTNTVEEPSLFDNQTEQVSEEADQGDKTTNKSVENSNLTNENQGGTIEENPTGAGENQTGEVAESGETENTRGTENLQGDVGKVQGRGTVRTGDDSRTGEGRVGQNSVEERSEGNGKDISLLKNSKFKSVYNARNEKKTEVKDWRDLSDSDEAKQVFVDALNASKEADMQHGVYVDGKTVEELKDCKVILHKNKMAGFAITPDGNIVGVFSNPKNPIRGILNDMIFIAHMMGGNRMDCFGNFLLRGYRACGFTPVAKTTFAEEYYPADNPANNTIRKEKPDVFFLVKDNDNNTAYLDKMNKGEYENNQIAIDDIPLIDSEDSYGDALGFQGQVLEEIQKKENKNKSTKEVADSLRPKEESTQTESTEQKAETAQNVQQESQTETTEQVQQTSAETESKEKTTPKKEETMTAEQIINKANSDKTFRENSAVYVREREDGTVYGQVWTRDENGENLRQIGEITSYDDFERADLEDEEYLAYGEDYSDDIVDGEGIAEAMFEDAGNNEAATAKQVLEKQIEKEKDKDKKAFYRHVIKKIGSYIADRGHISDDESEGIKSLFDNKEDVDIYNDEEGFIKEVDSVYKKYAKIKQEEKDAKKRAKERDKLLDKWQEQTREREYDEIDKGINEVAEDIKKNVDSYADDFYQAFRNYLDSDYDSNVRIGNGDIQEKKNGKWTHIRDLTKSERDLVKRIDDLSDRAQGYDDLLDKFETIVPEKEQTSPQTETVNEDNIENNTKTYSLTEQQNQTKPETRQTTIDKSDKNYQKAVELVIQNRGMSTTGLRFALENEGIKLGRDKVEQYLVQMENDGIVEHGDEGSLRMLKKNPSTKMQEAGQNAENQTLLTPQVEEELENLFWKLIRKKQFHGMDSRWESGKLDYYKSLSNRRQGKEFNPEFIKGDKAFLNAIKNVNDYIHEKFPQYKNVYRGVDGHWRFEFSDKDAHFINGFEKLSGKTLDTTLDKILKHNNLYKFYSKLKGMPVHLVRNTKMQEIMEDTEHKYYAMYDPDEKAIYINSDMFESNDEVRNSLLHEIQHAIQDIEGFANGTNDNAYNNDYDFSEGEKQAVLTEKRSNMSNEELQQNPRSKTLNPNEKTIIQEQRPVKKVAKSPSTKMQANGEQQKADINTPQFKKWFNGSVVKNKDGSPKVYYRGLNGEYDVNKQSPVTWVSPSIDQAYSYSDNSKHVYPVYVSVKNPANIGNSMSQMTMQQFVDNRLNPLITQAYRDKKITKEQGLQFFDELDELANKNGEDFKRVYEWYNNNDKVIDILKQAGYDALLTEEDNQETYGVFNKGDVKSVYNKGTFDRNNPDIKFQSSGNGQTNLGYIDKQKDIYSVTFTKSAQQNAENQKKIDFYRKNKSYWRENKDAQTGSITFTRALPYQQHQKTIIYDEINGKKVGKRKKAKWREYYEAFKDHVIKWLFNDKHFLEKAARNVGAIESYMRMMVMKDQGAVAGAAIEDGIVKHNGKNGERTKSLNSIIEAVGEENQKDFLNYCEAYRVLDLEKRNIYQKMTPKDARDEIARVKRSKNAKLFEQQRQNFVEYNHELLWVLVDGGFITEQQYNKFIENDPNFIPLAKNMDELEGYVDGFRDSKTMINVAHPMHKIGTSMREVANPFLEMQKRTVEYYVKASRNKAGHIFVHDIAEAIAQNAKGDVVAQNQGMVRKLASRDKNGKPISHDNKQYVFYVWENGEKQYYQVADREIYIALKSFDAEQMGALSKIMNATAGKASRLVRNTATMTPDFGLRNLVRDNMEAFISSEHGFLPLVDSLWGMYQMANDTQWFKEYQRMNGEHLSLNRDGEDVATVEHDIKDNVKFYKTIVPLFKKDLHEFMDKDRSKPARAKSLLKLVALDIVPLQSIYKANKRLNDYLETGTRIGEYRNARMGYKGLKGRLFETSGSTIWTTDMDLSRAKNTEMIAAYKSKDITLNFGQHGVLGKELNRYIPFFNASLQGIYKLGNTLDDMIHAEDSRRRQELMFKCALMGAMGMAAALAGQGDDDYDEAPDYEHENFWILPNGIRIPKDQLFGKLIGGTVEKATAQYLKDGDVKKLELVQDILGNFAIDKCVPALVDLGWGTIGNYDSFKKKSVTPEYMADKLGYLQKDLSTSKAGADISETIYKVTDGLFKALGYNSGGVDIGAKKVDFVISKTLSNLGKYATSLWELTGGNEKMTRGAEVEDKGGFAETSKELPYPMNQIVGTFATNRNSFQSISDFYERHRELKKLSSDESIMSKNEKKAWEAYQAAYKKDKQYRDALKAIKLDKSLTGAQKRQKADKIFKQQISMARKLHDWEKKHGLV